jgi:Nif-specific regulatory protein
VNVRILAATNKDIEALVDKGEFRSDLYYRLNVLPIYVPPLRQRSEDIPELAEFFLKKCIREIKKQFAGFSNDAMEAMLSYSWPGNIRELENSIERACVIGKNSWIRKEDLFPELGNEAGTDEGEGDRNLKTAINVFKTHFIQKVLEENNWNQTEAAKSLDIQRTYLSRLIKEFNIMNLKEN